MVILSDFNVANSCHSKVHKDLQFRFASPQEAVDHYFPQGLQHDDTVPLDEGSSQLTSAQKRFQQYALTKAGIIVPSDFLELSLAAMVRLKEAGRTNIVYNMVKAIGTQRPNSEQSLLPVTKMPMGLLEYCVNFFSSTHLQQVASYPNNYLIIYVFLLNQDSMP